MNLKKVLLVEDHLLMRVTLADHMRLRFGHGTEVLEAGTISEANRLFEDHFGGIDIIFMNINLGKGVTTFELTRRISQVFGGMIVAMSVDDMSYPMIMEYGYTHTCKLEHMHTFIMDLCC